MKRILAIGFVGCVVLAVLTWILRQSPTRPPELASFTGRTNGMIGAIAATFGTLSTNYDAAIKRWLDAGTNAAIFALTNQQVCSSWVSPFVTLCSDATQSSREIVPLLDAPDFSGLKLAPGQVVTGHVASVPIDTPWRAEFHYTRDSCSDSLRNRIKMIPEQLRALTTRTPVRVESHIIRSELIDTSP